MRDVEALVALQADEPRAEDLGERLRGLGLADSRLALEQERLLEPEREEEGGREAAVRQVRRPFETDFQLVDIRELHVQTIAQAARATTLSSHGGVPLRRAASASGPISRARG